MKQFMKSTSNLNAIFITGISASGKTTLAKELVKELRNTYLRTPSRWNGNVRRFDSIPF